MSEVQITMGVADRDALLAKLCKEVFGAEPAYASSRIPDPDSFPTVELPRLWDRGDREEQVQGLGDRVWRITDLREAVKDQPVFQVPLAFLDLANHWFDTEGGLITFAQHMKHVEDSDPDDPIIFDQWGRILDGRHRIVRALIEGRTTIPARKVPDGTSPTYHKQ